MQVGYNNDPLTALDEGCPPLPQGCWAITLTGHEVSGCCPKGIPAYHLLGEPLTIRVEEKPIFGPLNIYVYLVWIIIKLLLLCCYKIINILHYLE